MANEIQTIVDQDSCARVIELMSTALASLLHESESGEPYDPTEMELVRFGLAAGLIISQRIPEWAQFVARIMGWSVDDSVIAQWADIVPTLYPFKVAVP